MEDALYVTWAPRLVRFCTNVLRSSHDAEEVVQDVFTKLLQKEGRYELEQNPGVLLFRLVRNRCIDLKRKHRAEPIAGFEPRAPGDHRDLREALGGLTFEEREALLLTVQDGLTYRDVAKILGCSLGTVAARKYAAIEKLKEGLAP
jgi:RNA polymerase sigma-70 factor (ECF subfamily)